MNERPDEIRHNTDATDALDQFAIKRNNDQHDAAIGKAKAKTHTIESHADAEKIAAQGVADGIRRKHAAFFALACGAGIGLACWGASLLWTPRVVEIEKQVIVKEPVIIKETVIVKEPVITKETVIVKEPVLVAAPRPPDSPEPPRTLAETSFTQDKEGYAGADVRGRIVKSSDGDLYFDTGKSFTPHDDTEKKFYIDTDHLVGDFGYCRPILDRPPSHDCFASHNGVTVPILIRRRSDMTPPVQTTPPVTAPRGPQRNPKITLR